MVWIRSCVALMILLLCAVAACGCEATVSPPPIIRPTSPALTPSPPPATPTSEPPPTPSPPTPEWIADQQMTMTEAASADIPELGYLTRYDIDLAIGVESLTLHGRQVTRYTNKADTELEELYFNLFPNSSRFGGSMEIESARITEQEVPFDYELDGTVARVALPQPLLPGESITVTLDFTARVPHVQKNYYLVFVSAQGVLSLGDWHPMVAVHDDEGWNLEYPEGTIGEIVYSESAFYTVRITQPTALDMVATGEEPQRIYNDRCAIST